AVLGFEDTKIQPFQNLPSGLPHHGGIIDDQTCFHGNLFGNPFATARQHLGKLLAASWLAEPLEHHRATGLTKSSMQLRGAVDGLFTKPARNWAMPERRDCASARHSSIIACNVAGVNGLRRQREAPSSIAILRKSGAGELRFAKA